jgi:hypothetical protein
MGASYFGSALLVGIFVEPKPDFFCVQEFTRSVWSARSLLPLSDAVVWSKAPASRGALQTLRESSSLR